MGQIRTHWICWIAPQLALEERQGVQSVVPTTGSALVAALTFSSKGRRTFTALGVMLATRGKKGDEEQYPRLNSRCKQNNNCRSFLGYHHRRGKV